MREVMTKSMARNIFYGGSLFFILIFVGLIFVGLTAHSHYYIKTTSTNAATLTDDSVAKGKHIWEKHSCINCHTILSEGANFAPELGNVMIRFGLTDDEYRNLADFLLWTDTIRAQDWPPNDAG